MKQINHKQVFPKGIKSISIMPTYGTPSYAFRGKVGLPFTIDREVADGHLESESSLIDRLDNKMQDIESEIRKFCIGIKPEDTLYTGIWLKYNKIKAKVISHSGSQKSKVNKKKKRR